MCKELIGRSRKLVGAIFPDQTSLGEDIHVQVADDGVGIEGNAPLLVLVGHGVQSGLRRAGQVDAHSIGHLHEQALGSIVGQVGAVHDCHVGAIRRGQSGVERVIVAMPRSTAHTLNLDSPLVLCIELVGEDRDGRAFTVGLRQVSDAISLFLAVAKEASHGDSGSLKVVIADGSNCRPINSLRGGGGVHSTSGEYKERGRRQCACTDSRVTCQCASLSHCHAFRCVVNGEFSCE